MANPVIHFEILGKDARKSRDFYSALFGWTIDANNPMEYGMVEGAGLGGGVAGLGGPQDRPMVTVTSPCPTSTPP